MVKIEIELNDEQLEKLNSLTKDDIDFGEIIDNYFDARKKLSQQIELLEEDASLSDKIVKNTLDVKNKSEILDKNYNESDASYEIKIQDFKHNISWVKDFFKI